MRISRSLRLLAILSFVLPAAAAAAPPPSCAGRDDLAAELARQRPPHGTEILAFDHRTGEWSLCAWTVAGDGSAKLADSRLAVERGLDDLPRLLVEKRTRLAVYLVDTHPLAYVAERRESKESTAPQVADLQQFVHLLGSIAAAAIEIEASEQAMSSLVETKRSAREATSTKPPATPLERLEAAIAAGIVTPMSKAMGTLQADAGALARALGELDAQEGRVRAWVQERESATPPGWPPPLPSRAVSPHARFETLRASLADPALALPCRAGLEGLQARARLLCPGEKGPAPCGGTAYEFAELAARLTAAALADAGCAAGLADALATVSAELTRIGLVKPASADDQRLVEAAQLLPGRALELAKSVAAAVDKGRQAAAGESDAAKLAGLLDAIDRRYETLCNERHPCPAGIPPTVMALSPPAGAAVDLDWDRVREAGFTVSESPLFKGKFVPQRPAPAKLVYELERAATAASRLAIDYALLYTEVDERTFTAASLDPAQPDAKEIAVKERDTRAGEPVLFLTWSRALGGDWRSGPQVGVAVDSSKPSLYLGWSLRWKFVGVGAGWGVHRLTRLDGQAIGDPVVSNDDIRTEKRFETDSSAWYAALTISLTDLPFFKPKS